MSGDVITKGLVVKDLNFSYGKNKVLTDINASFKKRHITALIGPSGSGKSTLLRVINRIYQLYPDQKISGDVLMDGQSIFGSDVDLNWLRGRIGMVFQKPTPFPMSIFNNIAFGVKLHEKLGKAELAERVEWALRKAALWKEVKRHLNKLGTKLSGGQQQRLCIARTIAIKPKVLLLDEPTSALDPLSVARVEQLIVQLKEDYTIVIVTHNLKQAERLADETIYMRKGQIIEHGPTQELFGNPQNDYTREYISDH